MGNGASSPRQSAQATIKAGIAAVQPELASLDGFERDVLNIARHFFEAFSRPASLAWIDAFRLAEYVFPMPFGATIGHAILIAINAMRTSRQRTFVFERPDSPLGAFTLTDTERYFMRILHDIRRGDRASARAHALFLCEGNDATRVLAAIERLAMITGDVDDPQFN